MSFHYFFQKPPPYDCFGIQYNEIIKAFVCLVKLSSSLMPFGTRKIAGLEFTMAIAASVFFPPLKWNKKSVACPRGMRKKIPSHSFHPTLHQDFEINFLTGTSETIPTLKMSQMVEILISDLVLIAN